MTLSYIIETAFWICLTLLFYAFAGYPLLVFLLSRISKRPHFSHPTGHPTISIVLATFNEEARIATRLGNLLSSDYPTDRIEVIVVSDGSTDGTTRKVREANDSRIHLIEQPHRSGKAQCLNIGVSKASGEIVVFSDTRQRFAPETIAKLVAHFSDPQVGAVSGALQIESAASSVGGGVDAYWRLEKFIRECESKVDSAIGCTGAVYAIRRELFQPLDPDTLLDDVVIPMQVALQGYRVLFDPTALAFDPQTLEPEREIVRKRRTLAGNYQMLFRFPEWILPWRNRLWWQLLSHKYLRLAGPFLLLAILFLNAVLWDQSFYRFLLWAQFGFYALAVMGMILSGRRTALVSIPAGFVFLNLTVLRGLWHYFQGPQTGWQTAQTATSQTRSNV